LNKHEKRILFGIYKNNDLIGRGIMYRSSELEWLIENPLSKASEWRDGSANFRVINNGFTEGKNYLEEIASRGYKVEKILSYLSGKKLIEYVKGESTFKISITVQGYEIARKLASKFGHIDIWYRDNKDGIVWFLITIITSAVVSIITTLILKNTK
jgi:hypothetical protein